MRYSVALSLGSILCFGLPALGQMFFITPIDADVETEDGVVWTIDTEGLALNTSRFSSGLERRAILEFPIDYIPVGVIIRSAGIEFEVAGLTYSGDIFPIIEFHGYAGDGILSVDDAERPANPIGQSDTITAPGERPFVDLDAAFVQSLIGQATHVGLYTYQVVLGRQVDFWSTEQADEFHTLIPAKLWLEVSVPVSHGGVIWLSGRRDLVWDPHRDRLYITTGDGVLERFDAIGRILLPPWNIGDSLLGADITPDGQFLFIGEELDVAERPRMHKVDLDTGAVTTSSFDPAYHEGRSWDIKIVNEDLGFVTTAYQGSGRVPFREFDVATGEGTIRADVPGSGGTEVTGTTTLRRSLDRSTMYVLEGNSTSNPIIVYDTATDSFVANRSSLNGQNEVAAASPSGGVIARMMNDAVELRDRALELITELDGVSGSMVFDPQRPLIYVAVGWVDEIIAFDTRSFEERFRMDIGEQFYFPSGFDEGVMEVSDTGSLLFLSTMWGVRLYELSALDREGVESFIDCFSGPDVAPLPSLPDSLTGDCVRRFDRDGDGDTDLADAALLMAIFEAEP